MRALLPAVLFFLTACGTSRRPAVADLAAGRAALGSSVAAERSRAAWDLGQLGLVDVPEGETESSVSVSLRAAAADALIPAVSDPEAPVRRAAIQSLGKTGGANIENTLHSAATDIDPGVRGEVALALFRMRFLKRVPEYSTASLHKLLTLAIDADPEVRWRANYAFSRFPDARAEKMLMQASKDPDKVTRLFAVRSLSKLGRHADVSLLSDIDPYVRAEAVASFGAAKAAQKLPPWIFGDTSPHVRAAAADAAAADPLAAAVEAHVGGGLTKMAESDTPMPRGRALLALGTLGWDTPVLELARKDPHWWVRSKAYEASASLPDAAEILSAGISDPDPRVAAQALETLAAGFAVNSSTAASIAIERVLRDPKAELELLGTAVDAAAGRKSPAFAGPLRSAWERPGLTAEVRDSIRKALKASGVVVKAGPALDEPKTFPPLSSSPNLVLLTEKGNLIIQLDADAAPNTVAAIADAARRGVYDGTVWHRVVTAFVVQGGDPRGSGWGDDGFRLEDEVNPLPFLRGTVGMPKAGPDTGGCQMFISLVPTPHLDGRYTAFGRVTAGIHVLDLLEPGDKILKALLRE